MHTLLAKCLKLAGVVLLVWANWMLDGETADCGPARTEHAKHGGAWTWWNGRGHNKADQVLFNPLEKPNETSDRPTPRKVPTLNWQVTGCTKCFCR